MGSLIRLTTIAMVFVSTLVNSANIPLRPVYERSEEEINFFGKPTLGRQLFTLSQDTQRFRSNFHVQNQQRRYISEKEKKQRAQARRFVPVPQDVMNRHIKENAERQELNLKELEAKFIREITAVVKANNYTTAKPLVQKKEVEKQNKTIKDLPNLVGLSETESEQTEQTRNKRIADGRTASFKSPRHIPYASYPRHYTQAHQMNFNANGQAMYGHQYRSYFPNGNNHNAPVKYIPTQQLYTEDVSSLTSSAFKYPAPEQEFSQLNVYKTNENYETSLEALLGKDPNDQIKGLNHLLQQSNSNHKVTNEDLRNVNINLKSSSLDVPTQYYAGYEGQPGGVFVTPRYEDEPKDEYQQVRDYTPITENVQDIADTRQPVRIVTEQDIATEGSPTLTSSSNYYKVEVASEVKELPISGESHIYTPSPNYVSGYDNLQYASKYEFGYRVRDPHTGSDFGHTEVSDGDSASGSYHVMLPDGRLQKVKYHAGPDGYKAQVTYH